MVPPHRRRLLLPALIATVLAATTVTALAAIPNTSTGVIDGCSKSGGAPSGLLTPSKGSLRVIDSEAGERCRSGETPIQWNQQGRKGDPGQPGPAGRDGVSGYEVVSADHLSSGIGLQTFTAQCPTGKLATGGGFSSLDFDPDQSVYASRPTPDKTAWEATVFFRAEGIRSVVYAICAKVA